MSALPPCGPEGRGKIRDPREVLRKAALTGGRAASAGEEEEEEEEGVAAFVPGIFRMWRRGETHVGERGQQRAQEMGETHIHEESGIRQSS